MRRTTSSGFRLIGALLLVAVMISVPSGFDTNECEAILEPYVRNLWYMAAWEQEVPDGSVLTRTLLDERWILYRKSNGGYAMLADRCPHRFAPLSRGRRDGDRIVCGYHGLGFGPDGQCV